MATKDFITPDRRGIVAEYLLNGDARDTSGNGYHGTPSGVVYEKTYRGYQSLCGKFDGSTSKVDLPNISSFSSFTITALVKFDTVSGNQHIVRIAPTSDNANVDVYLESNQIKFNTYNGGSANQIVQTGTVSADIWYLIIAKNDAGSGELHVIPLSGTGTVNFGPQHNIGFGTNYCSIGYGRQRNANFLDGFIQSVRIFNRALSEKEIRNWHLESLRGLGGGTLAGLIDGAVADYEFLGDALDSVGGFDRAATNVQYVTDSEYPFQCAQFNGTDSKIYLGNGNLISNGSYSVEVMFKLDSVAASQHFASRGNMSVDWGFILHFNHLTGKLGFSTHTAPTDNHVESTTSIQAGVWYHAIASYDSAGTMKLYLDGVPEGTLACGGSTRTYGTYGWTIGSSYNSGGYVDGLIAFARFYPFAFPEGNVKPIAELAKKTKLLPFE